MQTLVGQTNVLIQFGEKILKIKRNFLRNKEVPLVLVQWQHRKGSEMTWEPESEMREQHPELFAERDFEGEV